MLAPSGSLRLRPQGAQPCRRQVQARQRLRVVAAKASPKTPQPEVGAIDGLFHVVQRGETMWGISKRYGIEIDDICRLNPGVDPDRVYAGSRLLVAVLSQEAPAPRFERDDATDSWQAVFLAPPAEEEAPEEQAPAAPAPAVAAAAPAPAPAQAAPAAPSAPLFNPEVLWASPAVASVRSAVSQVPAFASSFASSPAAATLSLPLLAAVAGASVAVLMTRSEDDLAEVEAQQPPPGAPLSEALLWRGRHFLAAAGSPADDAGGNPFRSVLALFHAAASIAAALCLVALSAAAAAASAALSPARALLRALGGLWEMLLPPGHTRFDHDDFAPPRPKSRKAKSQAQRLDDAEDFPEPPATASGGDDEPPPWAAPPPPKRAPAPLPSRSASPWDPAPALGGMPLLEAIAAEEEEADAPYIEPAPKARPRAAPGRGAAAMGGRSAADVRRQTLAELRDRAVGRKPAAGAARKAAGGRPAQGAGPIRTPVPPVTALSTRAPPRPAAEEEEEAQAPSFRAPPQAAPQPPPPSPPRPAAPQYPADLPPGVTLRGLPQPPNTKFSPFSAQESPGDALVAAADAALALGREMQGAVVTAQVRRRPLMPDAVRAAAEAAGEQLAALTAETFRGQPTAALGFLTVDVGRMSSSGLGVDDRRRAAAEGALRTARAALPRNVNVVAVRIVDGFFRADGAEGRRGASVTLIAGPVGAFDSASVPISSGEDADPGVSNAAAEAAAALRARHQGPLRGIIAGGPTGWEEAALNGIAKEVVCSLYSIRSVKGPPGAWLVPVDSHKGAGLGLLAMGVTAISVTEYAGSLIAPAMMAQFLAAWRYGDEGVVVPRPASSLKTVLAHTADHWRPTSPEPGQKPPRPYNTGAEGGAVPAGARQQVAAAGAGARPGAASAWGGAGAAGGAPGYQPSRWGGPGGGDDFGPLPDRIPPRESMYK